MNRILTTHVGSLPRPKHLVDLLFAQDRGEAIDPALLDDVVQRSVNDVVRLQGDAGLDVVSDGEMSKISYATYIRHRLTGFEGDSARPTPQDLDDFPRFRDQLVSEGHSPTYRRPVCTGPIGVKDCALVTRDIARLRQALTGSSAAAGFMTAVSPGTIGVFHPNQHYRSHEAYMCAVATAMRSEYEEIVGAGSIRHSRGPHAHARVLGQL